MPGNSAPCNLVRESAAVPIEIAKALRLKGAADSALAAAPKDGWAAAGGLLQTYGNIRTEAAALAEGTEAEAEFLRLFPSIPQLSGSQLRNVRVASIAGDRARVLLAALSGWLGSWPSAERLLEELIHALEVAEATADDPDEKARLAGVLAGLRGAGREIAIGVVTAYLTRVHV